MDSLTFVLSLLVLGVHSLLVFGAKCCYIFGKRIMVGSTYSPKGQCAGYKCLPNKDVFGKTCPLAFNEKMCQLAPPDFSKPYPACCSTHYVDC